MPFLSTFGGGSSKSFGLARGRSQYKIQRSLRFNSADSANLSRTPAGAGNRKTWTWSGWVKISSLTTTRSLFGGYSNGTNYDTFWLNSSDGLSFSSIVSSVGNTVLSTTQLFRDVSAWYHIILAVDTDQATPSNRYKIYVNGSQVTAFNSATYASLSYQGNINNSIAHYVGWSGTGAEYLNGYLTEVNFIDGSALTPSSFGEINPDTGVWSPKKYSGTYGTNGFYLDFSDNSNTTSSTLGKDRSGNNNDWTPNSFSVAAGAGNDSLLDTPTPYGVDTGVGGEVRGNYATLNPLDVSTSSQLTLSDGNLIATQPSTGTTRASASTFRVTTGKWYFEGTTTVTSGTLGSIGIANDATASISAAIYRRNGATAGLSGNPTFATYTNGDVIGVAFDVDAKTISFYKNGTLQGTGNYTWTSTDPVGARVTIDSGDSTGAWQMNFGQRPFAYAAPTGFKTLCTTNLP